jgi:N-methylhydantoinase B
MISLSGAVIAKMLSCASPELQRLAIGPANPAFYATITGGEQNGRPFIAPDVSYMIGGLSATPHTDGVDFGGHFWIPEGEAGNVEELELLWPMLFLYRRAMPVRADGAGRYRGGRGFVEACIPWSVPGLAAALYIDESFPSLVGPFGGNPGTMGRFRLTRGSDVRERLARGEVPQDFDAVPGEPEPVQAKGPMLMVGADDVWEWTGANGAGYGDPLTRDPAAVLRDVLAGGLDEATARRVYSVVLTADGDAVDEPATERARRAMLTERLAAATAPTGGVSTVDSGATIRPISGELGIVERDGAPDAFASLTGRAVLGPVTGNFKEHCAVLERPTSEVGPEYASPAGRAGERMRYREYLCPATGLRIDSEIVRPGEDMLHGVRLTAVTAAR